MLIQIKYFYFLKEKVISFLASQEACVLSIHFENLNSMNIPFDNAEELEEGLRKLLSYFDNNLFSIFNEFMTTNINRRLKSLEEEMNEKQKEFGIKSIEHAYTFGAFDELNILKEKFFNDRK